jgi:site-specific recombinase XerD
MPKATATIRDAIDAFLSSKRCANPNTRRAYGDALDKVAGVLDPARPAADLTSDDLAAAVHDVWGESAPATWNQRRAAVGSWVAWCAKNGYPLPELPAALERQPERLNETRALARAAIERALTRKDVPLREKTLWRMLYETAARASEILALDIEDLELDARRAKIT